jgi:hypothetical protein
METRKFTGGFILSRANTSCRQKRENHALIGSRDLYVTSCDSGSLLIFYGEPVRLNAGVSLIHAVALFKDIVFPRDVVLNVPITSQIHEFWLKNYENN